jgi:hypothetical protein
MAPPIDYAPLPPLLSPQLPFLLPSKGFPNLSFGGAVRLPFSNNFHTTEPVDNLPQLANTKKAKTTAASVSAHHMAG